MLEDVHACAVGKRCSTTREYNPKAVPQGLHRECREDCLRIHIHSATVTAPPMMEGRSAARAQLFGAGL